VKKSNPIWVQLYDPKIADREYELDLSTENDELYRVRQGQ